MIVGSRKAVLLLAIAGLIIGVSAGLYLAWQVWPATNYASDPAEVRREYVADYVVIIACHYAVDGDLAQAQASLQDLGLPNTNEAVLQVTNRYLAAGSDLGTVRALVHLAHDLGVSTSAMTVYLQTATPTATHPPTITPTPSVTPTPTETSTPTLSPTATPSATGTPVITTATPTATATSQPTFKLTDKRKFCIDAAGPGKIEVFVQDAVGRGVAGVKIVVAWPDGEEAFFTGLKPEHDPGYADYELFEPWQDVVVSLARMDGPAPDVPADPEKAGCPAGSKAIVWQLTFAGNQR